MMGSFFKVFAKRLQDSKQASDKIEPFIQKKAEPQPQAQEAKKDISDNALNMTKKGDSHINQKEIQGEGFVMREGKQSYPYNAFVDIEEELAKELGLPHTQIRMSLAKLYEHHKEMFANKRDVYNTAKSLLTDHDYAGDSHRNPKESAYIAKLNTIQRGNKQKQKITDMAINRESNNVIHLNKNRKTLGKDRFVAESAQKKAQDNVVQGDSMQGDSMVETVNPPHRELVPYRKMNTSKEHFSPNQSNNTTKDMKAQYKKNLDSYILPTERE